MKDNISNKWIYIVWIIVILAIAGSISDCSDSKKTEFASIDAYIMAVDNKDYEQAHKILNKLKASYLQYWKDDRRANEFWTAANYIYKAEMQCLLLQNDSGTNRRILYVLDNFTPIGEAPEAGYAYTLSEHNGHYEEFDAYINFATGYNKLCLEIIRIALRNNNLELAKSVSSSMKDNYHEERSDIDKTYTYILNRRAKEEGQKLIEDYVMYKCNDESELKRETLN